MHILEYISKFENTCWNVYFENV